MTPTKNPAVTASRPPRRRGAAELSHDGVARITVPLQPRLSASELTRVLTAAPTTIDFTALDPVRVRSLIAEVLTQHGYDVLTRSPYDPTEDRHQDARRAIRAAYGHRFRHDVDEQRFLAEPLRETFAAGLLGDEP